MESQKFSEHLKKNRLVAIGLGVAAVGTLVELAGLALDNENMMVGGINVGVAGVCIAAVANFRAYIRQEANRSD